MKLQQVLFLAVVVFAICFDRAAADDKTIEPAVLTLVVMDPLCDKLACDCVEGYAQRKYEVLGAFLTKKLKRPVKVFWGETIESALEGTKAKPHIIVGKHSVVMAGGKERQEAYSAIASLTGSKGGVTQTGLIVVRKNDPAQSVSDLKDYRIFFGPQNCDEKFAAPVNLLKKHGIPVPKKLEISGACSEAATKLVELDSKVKAAAIISSYAEPLLAGCGTIKKGDLRVIGTSEKVPFVVAFVNNRLSDATRKSVADSLFETGAHPELTTALQSLIGFVPSEMPKKELAAKPQSIVSGGTKNVEAKAPTITLKKK